MAKAKRVLDDWLAKLDSALHEKNSFTTVLEKLESKTGVKRLHLTLGLIAFLMVYLMFGYGANFLCCFMGFLYPAYASIKAIESKEKDDDTKWLTYWVVYSLFLLIEFFADIFLFWVPLYHFFKCLFLIYCMAPTSWNGSITIYYKIIRPFFLKHEKTIDSGIDQVSEASQTIFKEAKELSEQAASDMAKKHLEDKTD